MNAGAHHRSHQLSRGAGSSAAEARAFWGASICFLWIFAVMWYIPWVCFDIRGAGSSAVEARAFWGVYLFYFYFLCSVLFMRVSLDWIKLRPGRFEWCVLFLSFRFCAFFLVCCEKTGVRVRALAIRLYWGQAVFIAHGPLLILFLLRSHMYAWANISST